MKGCTCRIVDLSPVYACTYVSRVDNILLICMHGLCYSVMLVGMTYNSQKGNRWSTE